MPVDSNDIIDANVTPVGEDKYYDRFSGSFTATATTAVLTIAQTTFIDTPLTLLLDDIRITVPGSPGIPQLTIIRSSPTTVTLSRPAAAEGYTLQAGSSLKDGIPARTTDHPGWRNPQRN